MSVICDVVILSSYNEEPAMEAVNATLREGDTARHQEFRRINTDLAGGSKVFCAYVWAGAFNHLVPTDIEDAIRAAPWQHPDHVTAWFDPYDYGYEANARTVTALREGAELGPRDE